MLVYYRISSTKEPRGVLYKMQFLGAAFFGGQRLLQNKTMSETKSRS